MEPEIICIWCHNKFYESDFLPKEVVCPACNCIMSTDFKSNKDHYALWANNILKGGDPKKEVVLEGCNIYELGNLHLVDEKLKSLKKCGYVLTGSLFRHLLDDTADHDDFQKDWSGSKVFLRRGQIVTSTLKLAKDLRSTRSKIRRALNRLVKCGLITYKGRKRYTVVTIPLYANMKIFT